MHVKLAQFFVILTEQVDVGAGGQTLCEMTLSLRSTMSKIGYVTSVSAQGRKRLGPIWPQKKLKFLTVGKTIKKWELMTFQIISYR